MFQNAIKALLVLVSAVASAVIYFRVDYIRMGGPVMVPLLLSSIFGFAITVEKFTQFSRESINTKSLLKSIFESIERQRIKEAIDLCDQVNVSASRILKDGIMKYDRPKEDIKESMQDSFLYELPFLEDKLPILATLVQIAPLLGFLGTLVGLANIFRLVQSAGGSALTLATGGFVQGVWQALVCSMTGLLVALPLLVAHNYLSYRVKVLVGQMETASTELLNFLIDRRMP